MEKTKYSMKDCKARFSEDRLCEAIIMVANELHALRMQKCETETPA